MRWRLEPDDSHRQVWCYDGRRMIQGEDCYVWMRYLSSPDPVTGFVKMAYAHPVATFGLCENPL